MESCLWETGRVGRAIEVGQTWIARHSGDAYIVTADIGYGWFDVIRLSDNAEFRFPFSEFLGMYFFV